jgi:hypothetical protein
MAGSGDHILQGFSSVSYFLSFVIPQNNFKNNSLITQLVTKKMIATTCGY